MQAAEDVGKDRIEQLTEELATKDELHWKEIAKGKEEVQKELAKMKEDFAKRIATVSKSVRTGVPPLDEPTITRSTLSVATGHRAAAFGRANSALCWGLIRWSNPRPRSFG